MNEKFLPWFLLFCALGLSGTAAYYSVVGLSIVFVGVAIPVIIMGSFLEISKIAIATYLHENWKNTYGALKIYMTIALVTLSIITSLGIYGLLSTGFQGNIAKLEINEKQVKNVEVKKKRFDEIKIELTKEKTILDGDITKLRDGLSNNTTTQTVDRKTGQVITKANNANRKSFEGQLKEAQVRRDTIAKRIDAMNDSITNLEVQILNMESEEISGSELGAIKYVSEILDWEIKRTANLFILILIFVFDPLAITLVIATNQAFKSRRKVKEEPETILTQVEEIYPVNTPDYPVSTPQVTPQVEVDIDVPHEKEPEQVPTNYQTSTEQVIEDTIVKSDEDDYESVEVTEIQEDEIKTEDTKQVIIEESIDNQPKKLSYLNRDGYGKSLRIDRF